MNSTWSIRPLRSSELGNSAAKLFRSGALHEMPLEYWSGYHLVCDAPVGSTARRGAIRSGAQRNSFTRGRGWRNQTPLLNRWSGAIGGPSSARLRGNIAHVEDPDSA